MGTGWRRAFCTTIPRDPDSSSLSEKQQRSPSSSPSPRSCTRLGFLSGGSSNPSTPRLHCRTTSETPKTPTLNETPRLECNTNASTTPKTSSKSSSTFLASNQTSPRSPLKLSLFKNSFKFRSSCGICLNSVKTGQGTAIYTAECAHAFHFPCIADCVRKHGKLVCPVCNTTWKDVPLLAIHKTLGSQSPDQNDVAANNHDTKPKIEEKKTIDSSPRALQPKPETQLRPLKPTRKPSSESRSYDDDEPLLSPTAGSRITPIPEADENAEADDVEDEFQGFFVNNPNPPSSSIKYSGPEEAPPSSGRDHSRNVRVRLLPESALLSAGRSHETHVVALRVKAPPARNTAASAPSDRAPIDLVTVLDVSGSMIGAKLNMLKRAMRLVISSLGSADRLSIVAFSATSKRLLPLRRMTAQGQQAARRIVDRLVCGQGTCVGDALRKASKVLEDRRERNPVGSIMLLSDGQDHDQRRRVHHANNNQRQASSHVSSTRFAHIEIPVHKFGFGDNEHEPAEDAFAKCVGGLLSVVVQDLRIQLGFPSPAEISAIYSCNGRPTVLGSGSVRLGDMYAEEERELLVELRVPTSATVGTHHVMSFRCLYKDPVTQEVVCGKEQALLVPRPHGVGSSTPRIERLRNLFITTRAIAESRRLIEHDELSSAHQLLASARALLLQSSSELAEEYVRSLEAELAEVQWRRQQQQQQMMTTMLQRRRGHEKDAMGANMVDENGEPLTPTSAWRAAEKLAKVAIMKKSLNRVSDLHGFENARF